MFLFNRFYLTHESDLLRLQLKLEIILRDVLIEALYRLLLSRPLDQATIEDSGIRMSHGLEHPNGSVAHELHGTGVVADDLRAQPDVVPLHGVYPQLLVWHHLRQIGPLVSEVLQIQEDGSRDMLLDVGKTTVVLSHHTSRAIQDHQVLFLGLKLLKELVC